MKLSGQFQVCLLFFIRKKFERTKNVTSKNQLTKQKQANKKQQRQQFFAHTRTFKRRKIVCFAFWYGGFFTLKIFSQKKKNKQT